MSQNINKQRVAIIGASAVGKTCFIAALRLLGSGRYNKSTQFANIGASGDTNLYLKTLERSLCEGKVPEATQNESRLEFSEKFCDKAGRQHTFSFLMRDYKGESLKDIDSKESDLFKSWRESDYLLVLLDAQADIMPRNGTQAVSDVNDVISQIEPQNKKLAILMTKADTIGKSGVQCDPADAMQFFRKHRKRLSDQIDKKGWKWRCFFISSLGAEPEKVTNARGEMELHTTSDPRPFGYEALFDWMSENEDWRQIKHVWRRDARWLLVVAGAVLLWCVVAGVRKHGQTQARLIAENPLSTQKQIADATHKMKEADRHKFIDRHLSDLNSKAEEADGDVELLDKLLKEVAVSKEMKLGTEEKKRLDKIEQDAKAERSRKLITHITDAYETGNAEAAKRLFEDRISDLTDEDMKRAKEIMQKIRDDRIKASKEEIASIGVNSVNDTALLNRKIAKIWTFPFEHANDKEIARTACADMKKLMGNKTFKITAVNVGDLSESRTTFVILASGKWEQGKWVDEELESHRSTNLNTTDKTGTTQWESSGINGDEICWEPGYSLRIEWINKRWYAPNEVIAYHEVAGSWLSLLEMLQYHKLVNSYDKDDAFFRGKKPWVEIACEDFPSPSESLNRIKKFIIPGSYWTEGE